MHEYTRTNEPETDYCIDSANKAHYYYFADPVKYGKEFVKAAKQYFRAAARKFCLQAREDDFGEALKKIFKNNTSKISYVSTEFYAVRQRLKILELHPEHISYDTVFVLEHTARFIEILLPYVCPVKQENKFSFENIVKKEFTFFSPNASALEKNEYLAAFYDNAWRAQKNLNGFNFIRDKLDLADPRVAAFFRYYGGYDQFSSLIFARMANEQFLKYLSERIPAAFENMTEREISIPARISALLEAGCISELIANEAKLVNTRGNNIAHRGTSVLFSSCYHNLQVLSYFDKYCR